MKRAIPSGGFRIGQVHSAEDRRWTVRGSDGSVSGGDWSEGPLRELTVPFGRNAYCALLDSPLGGEAVFPLSEGLELRLRTPGRNSPEIRLSPERAPRKAGERRRISLLLLGIPRPTRYTPGLPADSRQTVERFYRELGLDGGRTGYALEVQAGRVTGRRYLLDVDGRAERCFSGRLTGRIITSLPIHVSGMHDGWSCYLYDRRRRQARPVGVFEGGAWATVCLSGAEDLFVGHPVLASNPALRLQVTQTGEQRWRVEVHNPTDRPIRTALRLNRRFDPLHGKTLRTPLLIVPAGGSTWVDL
jgi:hypothetical protein